MLLDEISARLNEPPRPAIRRYQPAAMRSPLLDELTAIHEAGHAVLAHVHDRPIHSAALTDGGGGEFRHHSNQPIDEAGLLDAIVSGLEPSPSARDTWRSSLIEVAAGRAAERKFGATQDFYDANGSHDREKLVAVACATTFSLNFLAMAGAFPCTAPVIGSPRVRPANRALGRSKGVCDCFGNRWLPQRRERIARKNVQADFGTSPGEPELSQDEKKSQQRVSRASVLQGSELESCSRT
jgi:hypothetical protein